MYCWNATNINTNQFFGAIHAWIFCIMNSEHIFWWRTHNAQLQHIIYYQHQTITRNIQVIWSVISCMWFTGTVQNVHACTELVSAGSLSKHIHSIIYWRPRKICQDAWKKKKKKKKSEHRTNVLYLNSPFDMFMIRKTSNQALFLHLIRNALNESEGYSWI